MISPWLAKIWLKRFLSFRLYVVIAALSIAFAIALAVCLMNLSRDLSQALSTELKASHGGDVVATWDAVASWPVLEQAAGEAASRSGDVVTDLTIMGPLRVQNQGLKGSFVVVRGITPRYPLYGTVRLEEPQGVSLTDLFNRPGSALISRTLAERLRLKPGDELSLGAAGESRTLRILGIVADDGHKGQDMHIWGYALVDSATAQEILPAFKASAQLQIRTDDAEQAEQIAASWRRDLPAADIGTLAEATAAVQEEIDSLNLYFYVIAALAFLICIVSVAIMVWFQVVRDIEALAILRSIGLVPSDGLALFFLQVSALAFIGGGVGALAGEALTLLVVPALAAAYHVPLQPLFHFDIFLLGLGLAFGFAHAASFLPVITALATRPGLILRQDHGPTVPVNKTALIAYLFVIALALASLLWLALDTPVGFIIGWVLVALLAALALGGACMLSSLKLISGKVGALFDMALKNLLTYRFRSAAAVMGAATSALMLVVLLGGVDTFKQNIKRVASNSFDVVVEAPLASYQEEGVKIAQMSGVASVDAALFAAATLELPAGGQSAEASARDRAPGLRGVVDQRTLPPLIAGAGLAESKAPPGQPVPALISQRTAERQNIQVGDVIVVTSKETALNLVVSGIYQRLVITLGDAIAVRTDDLPPDLWSSSLLLVKADADAGSTAIAETINQQLPLSFAYSAEQILPLVDAVVQDKWLPAIALGALASAAGLVVCLSGIFLSLSQHSRDFGVIKALGGTRRSLLKLVGYEYALIGLVGAAGGAALGASLLYVAGLMVMQSGALPRWRVLLLVILLVAALVELLTLGFAQIWIRIRPAALLRAG